MPTGSCLCGGVQIEITNYKSISLCHCLDCRKITSSLFAYNVNVRSDDLKITKGTLKEYTKTADSSNKITTCFCPECGSTIYRYGERSGGVDGIRIVKAGVLDDLKFVDGSKPTEETHVTRRVAWIAPHDGAKQLDKE